MKLPNKREKAERRDPKTMIIFGQPKQGKTTAIAALDDCLILDLEEGTSFVDAMKIDVLKEARDNKIAAIAYLKKVINTIKEANEEKGGYVYKYIAIDTVTALEDVVLPLAKKLYQNTPMGRNFVGDDVTTLPNGAGYRWTRLALQTVLQEIKDVTETLIIIGHVKDKYLSLKNRFNCWKLLKMKKLQVYLKVNRMFDNFSYNI